MHRRRSCRLRISHRGDVIFTAFCTFSKARTSIWRTRSRETPYSSASSSSVVGSSASRRASKMRRSRSLSTESASPSALWRFSDLALGKTAFLTDALVDQPILPSPESPSSRIGALSEASPQPAVHVDHVLLGDAEPLGDQLDLSGRMSPSSSAEIGSSPCAD